MKYLHLVVTNLFRKKTRTALTAGSFAVALFLFGILAAVDGAFKQGVDAFRAKDWLSDSDRATLMGGSLSKIYGWAPKKG